MRALLFGFGAKLPLLLQTEAAECGLACLGMVAGYYGYQVDLATLRRSYPISQKGITLASMIHIANQLQLATRPVKLDLPQLQQLQLPCILHWNLNHFVVLQAVNKHGCSIVDPAIGIRHLKLAEVSNAFTGVALELWPNPGFKPAQLKTPIKLQQLLGHVSGWWRSATQILLLALALEIFALVGPFYLQWVLDNVLVSADSDLLSTLLLGFTLVLAMKQATSLLRGWVIMFMGTTLNLQWRANVFTHLLQLPVEYFGKRHLGDVLSRFGAIDTIQRTLTSSFLEAILDGLMTIVTLGLMFMYSPALAWIAVITMLLYACGRWICYAPLRHATEEQIIHAAKQQSHFMETLRGVKTIKLFQRQDERRSSWLNLLVDQINADLRCQKINLLIHSLNGLLFGLENLLIVYCGAKLVLGGQFSVGVLMAFIAYKEQFDTRVAALLDKYVELKMLQLQGERLADIVLQTPETPYSTLATDELPAAPPAIDIKDLYYRYAAQEPWVLDGVSFSIAPGESVAIVGASGCGKSTLINVMLGILPATAGSIIIGGNNLAQTGSAALRRMVGTVLQDDVLFAGSIADNISFFDPHPNQAWIMECAAMAAVHTDIMSMPMTYNTLVGDMGTVLSGGQKQRILLARALYKRPQILFLDEATSHLDIAREQQVNAAIQALHMTRIIVAHRPETINTADRIICLEHGKIVRELTCASKTLRHPVPSTEWVSRPC